MDFNILVFLGICIICLVLTLRYISRPGQIILTWASLTVLLIIFFISFNLSYNFIFKKIGYLIYVGLTTTLYVSIISIILACILGLILALGKLAQNGILYAFSTFYISFFRGTPLLLQVYLIYLGLPQINIVLPAIIAGIISLSLGYAAYMAEIFRSGIQNIPKGQWEAAQSLGFNSYITFIKIIMPQSMRLIIPPIGSQFISMLKDSSLVSVLGVWELMFVAKSQGRSEFKNLEMLITAAFIYWFVSLIFELLQAKSEKYFSRENFYFKNKK
ncbi:MAG: amino acid ABC transporter permease [Alphaproteobacteria bacterium]|nr:amino acid ABC transporter permease [Alphaproteobacteria bacterium]